jgi:hypothetical protein
MFLLRVGGAITILCSACAGAAGRSEAVPTVALASTPVTAYDVDSALAQLFTLPLWPDFEPRQTPVAIFDGENTVLFRHPQPPPAYISLSSRRGVYARPGRDTLVNSNTNVMLGGVPTATVMLRPRERSTAREWAAVTAHEIFHVFQRARHPSWSANEAELFTYPVDDVDALALRRRETTALRRALAAAGDESADCWAGAFSMARRARFAAIGASAAAYERGTELNEGLARYVQLRALRRGVELPLDDFPAEQVRARAYEIGAAMGQLLDRMLPAWRDTLERAAPSRGLSIDALIDRTLASRSAGPLGDACGQSAADSVANVERAHGEVRGLVAHRTQARADYLALPGWRVVIEGDTPPLSLQGFDPLNVSRLSAAELLHTRFLKLGNDRGGIELLGRPALTEGRAGQHPLFAGVRRVTIAGLEAPLAVRDSEGVLLMEATGLRARLRGAVADTAGTTISVHPSRARP